MSVSSVIAGLIDGSGLSIKEVSRRTGIGYSTLHSLATREAQRPDIKILKALADFFNEDLEIFCEGESYERRPRLNEQEKGLLMDFRQLDQAGQEAMQGYVKSPPKPLTAQEQQLLRKFNQLNSQGQSKALEDISDLTELPKYKKS